MVRKYDPKTFYTMQSNWMPTLEKEWKAEKDTYVSKWAPEDFQLVPRAMQDWVKAYLDTEECPDRPKTLVIWGSTRLGKTAWSRSLGKFV